MGHSNKWAEKFPELDSEKHLLVKEHNKSFMHWVLKSNFVGKLLDSTVFCAEYTTIGIYFILFTHSIDEDVVQKFHDRGMIIGIYTIFPEDIRWTKKPLNQKETVNLVANLFKQKIDWIESDDAPRVVKILEALKANKSQEEILKLLEN